MALEHLEKTELLHTELDALLVSDLFARAPLMQRLLTYLVDRKIAGHGRPPKSYQVATEALGRSADFDPATDSYPRVMIGRLRTMLDRYYAETVWERRLRIPLGSYEIVVQEREGPPAAAVIPAAAPVSRLGGGDTAERSLTPQSRFVRPDPATVAAPLGLGRRSALALGAAALVLFGSWWLSRSPEILPGAGLVPPPLLEISVPDAGESGTAQAMARALDGKLRDGFRRFDSIQLLSARGVADSSKRQPDFRLESSVVRKINGPIDVNLVLNRVADERTMWTQQYRFENNELPAYFAIEPAIAKIAGDYGLIVQDQLRREPDNFAAGFPCMAHFNRVRITRDLSRQAKVAECLRRSVKKDPGSPVFLGALSQAQFATWQAASPGPVRESALDEAQSLAWRAYQNGPTTVAGLFALARSRFYTGQCQHGIPLGAAAIETNPLDPDMIGNLGLFELSCGRTVQGEALLRRSIALDASHSRVPTVTLAFVLLDRGQGDEAMALLDRLPPPTDMEPQFVLVRALILAQRGERAEARRLWSWLVKFTGQPVGAPPEAVLRQFMISPASIDRVAAAVRKADLA